MHALAACGCDALAACGKTAGLAAPRDWPASLHISGFAFPPATPDEAVAPALREFVAAGDAPVYLGFGAKGGHHQSALQLLVWMVPLVLPCAALQAPCLRQTPRHCCKWPLRCVCMRA